MDHPVLVDIDVSLGAKIVDALNADSIEFKVALWATFPEYYSPRLVFAADWLDQFSPLAKYDKFGEAIRGKFSDWTFPPLLLMKMTDPFIVELRQRFAAFKDVRGKRLDGESFGGRYLEDGYVYRIE